MTTKERCVVYLVRLVLTGWDTNSHAVMGYVGLCPICKGKFSMTTECPHYLADLGEVAGISGFEDENSENN